MPDVPSPRARRIETLKAEVRAITAGRRGRAVAMLPFELPELDDRLAGGGLMAGALHEATGGSAGYGTAGAGMADDAAATLFTAGIAARRAIARGDGGLVLWAFARAELFAPGLQQAGLPPSRLIHAEAGSDEAVLAVMEEGLRHGGLAAVVGEVRGAGMAATRRLQLAAEEGGVTALLLRQPRAKDRDPLAEPSAATTRWRVACAPSLPTAADTEGIGRPCWHLSLVRQRGGDVCDWIVEGTDAEGRLALPAGLRHRPAAKAGPAVRPAARAAA